MHPTTTDQTAGTLFLLESRDTDEEQREQQRALFLPRLGLSEAERYARFTRRQRQRQFLLGRILLRRAVGSLTGVAPDAISVMERPRNAPQLLLAGYVGATPSFSLSHSGCWIACAVSLDAMLGLDIEQIDPDRDIVAMSETAFDASERAWLGRQPDAERCTAFHHLWSLKEAHFKLSSGQNSEPQRPNGATTFLDVDGRLAEHGDGWHRYSLPHADLSIVICSDRALRRVERIDLTGLDCALDCV